MQRRCAHISHRATLVMKTLESRGAKRRGEPF
jgi:hypothetical protein